MKMLFFKNDLDFDNILISNRVSSGDKKKYTIGYADEYNNKPFTIIFA